MSDEVPVTDIGELRNLTVTETDSGTQVLTVGGDRGEAHIPVPEHMAVPFAEAGRRIADNYGLGDEIQTPTGVGQLIDAAIESEGDN